MVVYLFLSKHTATPEIYTLSLHDALPIFGRLGSFGVAQLQLDLGEPLGDLRQPLAAVRRRTGACDPSSRLAQGSQDRKSTRLNSSHANISYAVFCLKKKRHTAR